MIGNELEDEGAKHIAEIIAKNSTIEELYVKSKHTHEYMQTIDLLCNTCNNIGDNGAKHLADALKSNATLKEFSLRSLYFFCFYGSKSVITKQQNRK